MCVNGLGLIANIDGDEQEVKQRAGFRPSSGKPQFFVADEGPRRLETGAWRILKGEAVAIVHRGVF
jgi:hypothetical protein